MAYLDRQSLQDINGHGLVKRKLQIRVLTTNLNKHVNKRVSHIVFL